MRTLTRATVAAIAILAVGASTALAASVPTQVRIDFDRAGPARDVFRGQVESPRSACRQNRRVILFRKQPGPNRRIDSDDSEDNGRWAIDIEGRADGRYYARAPRKELAGADFCEADRSRTITVG